MYRRPPTSHRGAPTGRLQRRPGTQLEAPVSLQARMFWGVSFVIVLIALLWLIWPVFSMLVGSAALAYLLDPVVDRFERRGISRSAAIGVIFLTAIVATILIALFVVPTVAEQFAVLSQNISDYLSRSDALVAPAASWIEAKTGVHVPLDPLEIKAMVPDLVKKISPDARASIQGYLTGAFSSGLGIVLSVVLSILKFGFDVHLIGVAAAFAIPQAIEGWFLTPRIMGDKVGLHPMVIMVALIVGGNLMGIWGMLVAIPVTATAFVLLSEWLTRYRASRVFGDTPAG